MKLHSYASTSVAARSRSRLLPVFSVFSALGLGSRSRFSVSVSVLGSRFSVFFALAATLARTLFSVCFALNIKLFQHNREKRCENRKFFQNLTTTYALIYNRCCLEQRDDCLEQRIMADYGKGLWR